MKERNLPQKSKTDLEWWKTCTIYQICPRSFQDSNGDGNGDLPGLLSRVDYLAWLGIGAVWLAPFYRSPMLDFGYDISDFTSVDPMFGTLEDFDRVVEALHARDIKVILDVVPNHTSDQHPWFIESRSSRNNPNRDWYVWADPAQRGGPPNSWLSRFGGSGWEWDEKTGQYYYHAFLREQPDLNWLNPDVRRAFHDVLRFWLDRGVDGFRIDASAVLVDDPLLRDDPPNPEFDDKTPPPDKFKRIFTDARPETMTFLEDMRAVIDEYPDRVILGEVQGGPDRIGRFYGEKRPRFHLPLNFILLERNWDVATLVGGLDEYLNKLPDGGWPNWILGSHDRSRVATRIGIEQARVAAMLHLTLPGTPIFHSGDEIGMPDAKIPPHLVQDPFEKLVPNCGMGRDPERSPMRWDPSEKAGFTTGEPWMRFADFIEERNVETQRNDKRSMLWLYRRLLELRESEAVLRAGHYEPLRNQGDALLFERVLDSKRLLIALNIGDEQQRASIRGRAIVRLSTHLDRDGESLDGSVKLRPAEGLILDVDQPQLPSTARNSK